MQQTAAPAGVTPVISGDAGGFKARLQPGVANRNTGSTPARIVVSHPPPSFTPQRQLDFTSHASSFSNGPTSLAAPRQQQNANVNFYRPNLQVHVGLCRSSVPSRDVVKYDRETQTSGVERAEHPGAAMDYYVLAYDDDRGGVSEEEYKHALEHVFDAHPTVNHCTSAAAAAAAASRKNLLFSMSELSTEQPSLTEGADDDSAEFGGAASDLNNASELNEDQVQAMLSNEIFVKQLKHATTVMERLLSAANSAGTTSGGLPPSATSTSTLKLTQCVASSLSQATSFSKLTTPASAVSAIDAVTPLSGSNIINGIGSSALRDFYSTYADENDDDDDDDNTGRGRRFNVSIRARFYDEKYCRGKTVTHVAMSSQHSNLVAAAYEDSFYRANGAAAGGDAVSAVSGSGGNRNIFSKSAAGGSGHVMIWNLDYPDKLGADEVFRSPTSPVTVCEFSTHNQHHRSSSSSSLLIGGTDSGQICMWDMRSPRRSPVQTTAVSIESHFYPVHSLHFAGAASHSQDLISCSTDGRVCAWNIDNLSQPLEVLDLYLGPTRLSATCMRFLAGDCNNMLVGAEDGQVVSAYRHGQQPGLHESYESHTGPVISVDTHPRSLSSTADKAAGGSSISSSPHDFSSLFLTCSFDWSVKLRCWREMQPLHTFSTFPHVYTDCKWSPAHPAVFAAADESGFVHFYNINRETKVPVLKIDAGGGGGGGGDSVSEHHRQQVRVPLTKLAWDTTNGHTLCCGDRAGRLTVIDSRELMGPNGVVAYDEYVQFGRVSNEMRRGSAPPATPATMVTTAAAGGGSGGGAIMSSSSAAAAPSRQQQQQVLAEVLADGATTTTTTTTTTNSSSSSSFPTLAGYAAVVDSSNLLQSTTTSTSVVGVDTNSNAASENADASKVL